MTQYVDIMSLETSPPVRTSTVQLSGDYEFENVVAVPSNSNVFVMSWEYAHLIDTATGTKLSTSPIERNPSWDEPLIAAGKIIRADLTEETRLFDGDDGSLLLTITDRQGPTKSALSEDGSYFVYVKSNGFFNPFDIVSYNTTTMASQTLRTSNFLNFQIIGKDKAVVLNHIEAKAYFYDLVTGTLINTVSNPLFEDMQLPLSYHPNSAILANIAQGSSLTPTPAVFAYSDTGQEVFSGGEDTDSLYIHHSSRLGVTAIEATAGTYQQLFMYNSEWQLVYTTSGISDEYYDVDFSQRLPHVAILLDKKVNVVDTGGSSIILDLPVNSFGNVQLV